MNTSKRQQTPANTPHVARLVDESLVCTLLMWKINTNEGQHPPMPTRSANAPHVARLVLRKPPRQLRVVEGVSVVAPLYQVAALAAPQHLLGQCPQLRLALSPSHKHLVHEHDDGEREQQHRKHRLRCMEQLQSSASARRPPAAVQPHAC